MDASTTVIKISFKDVGRSKFTAVVDFVIPKANYKPDAYEVACLAFKEARKHLMSTDVECIYDLDKNEGHVNAGFHTVGHFTVVK